MSTKKVFLMSALAFLTCGCQEDEGTSILPTPGEEVKFGGMLDTNELTRTVYGDEAQDGSSFPIYWVNGDQVLIASPDCANNGGVGSATYAISVDGDQQNYATSMDKTGEIGVRWGDNATANFYSVYPASEYTRFTQPLTVARLTVTTQQNATWNTVDNTVNPDMSACFMYAKTENVQSGAEVNLAYKPLSTAVRFTVNGPTTGEPITISYARLYAPTGVALSGTFNVDFTQTGTDGMPTVSAVTGRTYNYASMNVASKTGSYLTLEKGESVDLQLFFLLERETTMDKNWYMEIATADGRSFIKHMIADDGGNLILKPGQIHKLPDLPTLTQSEEWDPSNWMANIQRNVYLSEISIPGSWNSLNRQIQGEAPSITVQYEAGVRAFHLDTRWRAVWVSDGLFSGHYEITDLGIADGGDTYNVEGNDGKTNKCMTQAATTFESALDEIVGNVKGDEYMVVFCTFAQGSTRYGDWRSAIADVCNKYDDKKVIDARTLTANSTVADVLGSVIVVVNTYTPGELSSKTFFTNMPNELDPETYPNSPYLEAPLTFNNVTNSGITLYATYAQITNDGNGATGEDGDRGYEPTLTQREQKCENLLNWSQDNYVRGTFQHNAWIYMGLGGYVLKHQNWDVTGALDYEDYTAVNNRLIPWLNGRLTTMENEGAYYPVGIVFMNDVVNHRDGNNVDISDTVKDILLLNNRYRKAYDPNRSPVDGTPISGEGGSRVNSAAPGYSSGMTDNRVNAIGWD